MDSSACSALSEGKKWIIGVVVGVLFFLLASPFAYEMTQKLTGTINLETSVNGCPNYKGVILHAIVFVILLRLLMFIKF